LFYILILMFGAGGFLSRDGWCLAGGRGCLLKGPHQIPGTSKITSFLVSSSRDCVYKFLSALFFVRVKESLIGCF